MVIRRQDIQTLLRAQLPFVIVMVIVLVAFERVVTSHWRQGAALIGLALLVAAGLRIWLRNGQAGLLAIRHKAVDVFCYSGLGLMLVYLAYTIKK